MDGSKCMRRKKIKIAEKLVLHKKKERLAKEAKDAKVKLPYFLKSLSPSLEEILLHFFEVVSNRLAISFLFNADFNA